MSKPWKPTAIIKIANGKVVETSMDRGMILIVDYVDDPKEERKVYRS